MKKYLARVEDLNGFKNLRPVMELSFDETQIYDIEDPYVFGEYQTITIRYDQYLINSSILMNDQKYSIVTLDIDSLKINKNDKEIIQIQEKEFLSNAINIDDSSIREVIDISGEYISIDIKKWLKKEFNFKKTPISTEIYLNNHEHIIGPFTWKITNTYKYIVSPVFNVEMPFFISAYAYTDIDILEFDASTKQFDPLYGISIFILNQKQLPKENIFLDYISQEDLKNIFLKHLEESLDVEDYSRRPEMILNNLSEIEFTEERKKRILKIIENQENIDSIIQLVPEMIIKNDASNKDAIDIIINRIIENTDYLNKIIPYIKDKKEVEHSINEQQSFTNNKSLSEYESINNKQIEKLEEELEKLKLENDELCNNSQLKLEKEELQTTIKKTNQEYELLIKMKDTVKEELRSRIQEAYTDVAFNGAIADLVLTESEKFKEQQSKTFQHDLIKSNMSNIQFSDINNIEKLIEFIVNEMKSVYGRSVSYNDIANILLCISCSFLTILAGEPGTGKTSLVNSIAHILGYKDKNKIHFVDTPVERGWTSKKDFIGYKNPFNKKLESHNRILSSFQAQDQQISINNEKYPYIILLDEANLSPMEYYWADFMRLSDLDFSPREFHFSDDNIFTLSDNLRFIATINFDHTTEIISPRLLDRAWIINLPPQIVDIETLSTNVVNNDKKYPMVSFEMIKKMSQNTSANKSLDRGIQDRIGRIQTLLKDIGIYLSPRSLKMIKIFCLNGKDIFKSQDNSYTALDYAVAQKILPLINGYGEDYEKFIQLFLSICDIVSMPISNNILNSILYKGKQNMGYFQYFQR